MLRDSTSTNVHRNEIIRSYSICAPCLSYLHPFTTPVTRGGGPGLATVSVIRHVLPACETTGCRQRRQVTFLRDFGRLGSPTRARDEPLGPAEHGYYGVDSTALGASSTEIEGPPR